MQPARLSLFALLGMPLVEPGDDLVDLILEGVARADQSIETDDVVVLAQKIVSKAQDRYVELSSVTPSREARELAPKVDKDPRLVELVLRESNEVVRSCEGVLVVEHRSGVVMANAGIDQSNIEHLQDSERVLLLPVDCDASAAEIRAEIGERCGKEVGVVINDSLGRAWRNGTEGTALGVAGLEALQDLRGAEDLFGRELRVTEVGFGDEIAAAASLLQGQAAGSSPVVLVRGFDLGGQSRPARDLVRPKEMDLFR
jgi:coenzyme F420-0:L-glutamate ligase/coenzyme F420-1:gamma-L-glutamate ligase